MFSVLCLYADVKGEIRKLLILNARADGARGGAAAADRAEHVLPRHGGFNANANANANVNANGQAEVSDVLYLYISSVLFHVEWYIIQIALVFFCHTLYLH